MRRDSGKKTKFHEQKLGHWVRIFGADCSLVEMTPPAFDLFVARRRGEGATDHTITKEVGAMLRVLRLAKRASAFAGDLAALRPFDLAPGYVPRTRALSLEEIGKLLYVIGRKNHYESPEARQAYVVLAFGLGLRKGEIETLVPGDFDFERGIVHVRGTKTEGADRLLPILAPFRGLVERAAAFVPVQPWPQAHRDIQAACRTAGIDAATPNDLRRTHATLLRTAGVDRDAVRRLLGHSVGSKMLETVYDQPSPRELAARAGDLGPLSSQLAAAIAENPLRAREDSNFRPTAPEAQAVPAENGSTDCEISRLGDPRPGEISRKRVAVSTLSSQRIREAENRVFRAKSSLAFARRHALPAFWLKARGWFAQGAA